MNRFLIALSVFVVFLNEVSAADTLPFVMPSDFQVNIN